MAAPKTLLKNYIQALVAKSEASNAHDFWSTIFCAQLSFEDISEVLAFSEVRKLREKQPKSLAMITMKSVEQAHLYSRYLLRVRHSPTDPLSVMLYLELLLPSFFSIQVHWDIQHTDGQCPALLDQDYASSL